MSVTSDDTGAATVSDTSLTFTTGNWNNPQTVTVDGENDSDPNNESVIVSLDASGGEYNGVSGRVDVIVTDDDVPNLLIPDTSLTVGEGGSGNFGVRLATQPSAQVTVSVASSDTGAATVSDNSLTFTTGDWNVAQTVTVNGVQDADGEDETVRMSLTASSSDTDYQGKTGLVTVTVDDDEVLALVVSGLPLAVFEGTSGSFAVQLATLPSGPVTVSVSSSDTSAATVSPGSLTFTANNWNTARTVTVFGVIDDDTVHETVIVSLEASGGGYDGVDEDVTVSMDDKDSRPPLVTIEPASAREGDDLVFRVNIVRATDGHVTMYYGIGNGTAYSGIDFNPPSGGNQVQIGFGNRTAEIRVSTVDDYVVEGTETFVVGLHSGSRYVLGTPNRAIGTITDNDTVTTTDRISDDVSTSGSIDTSRNWINGTAAIGRIDHNLDADWYRAELTEGRCYQIDVRGRDTWNHFDGDRGNLLSPKAELTLRRPVLSGIYSSTGTRLANTYMSSGRGLGGDVRANFSFNETGTYFISVSHRLTDDIGTYDLSLLDLGNHQCGN